MKDCGEYPSNWDEIAKGVKDAASIMLMFVEFLLNICYGCDDAECEQIPAKLANRINL